MCVGLACSFFDLFHRCIRFPVGDIFSNRRPEKDGILKDNSDLAPKRLHLILLDVDTIDQYSPSQGIIKTEYQFHEGRLTASGCPYQGHLPPGGDGKRDILQDIFSVSVLKRDLLEDDLPFQVGRLDGMRTVHDLRLHF